MLLKKQKGEYGYLKAYRLHKLLLSIIFACAIGFVTFGTILMFGDKERVMIVFAILLTLPFAKYFISWIVCVKFHPFHKLQYEAFASQIDTALQSSIYYDVVVSQSDGMRFFQSICVRNGRVYALSFESKGTINNKQYKRWIDTCLSREKEPYPVVVFDSLEAYQKKIKSVSAPTKQTAQIDRYMAQCILDTCV